MNTCQQCGHQGAGAFCGNCGAPLGAADATNVTAATTIGHHEGWQDEATSTGYVSNVGQPPAAPTPTPYRSSAPYGATGAAPVGGSSSSGRRSNQMLAGLVALAALAVLALGGYLFLRPKHASSSATGTPTSSNTLPSSTSSAPPSSTAAQRGQTTAAAPAPTTSTTTVTKPAPAASSAAAVAPAATASTADGSSVADIPGYLDDKDGYAIGRQGNVLTVYSDNGGTAQQVTTLNLKGGLGAGVNKEAVQLVSLPGCSGPIIVWNSGSANSSSAFGPDGNGSYQRFVSSGGLDMSPTGGDGSAGTDFGVYDKGDHVAYRSGPSTPKSDYNNFSSCNGTTLTYSGKGD